jgi:hypothetical protein
MNQYKVISLLVYGINLEKEINEIVSLQTSCTPPNRVECHLLTRDQFIRTTETGELEGNVYQYMGTVMNRSASFKTTVDGKKQTIDILLRNPEKNVHNIAYIVFTGCSSGETLRQLKETVAVMEEETQEEPKEEITAEFSVETEEKGQEFTQVTISEDKDGMEELDEKGDPVVAPEEEIIGDLVYELDELIDIPEYDREYSRDILVESLAEEIRSIQQNKLSIQDAYQQSSAFQDMMDKVRKYSDEGKYPQRAFHKEGANLDANPLIADAKKGQFDRLRIYPIVVDRKKVFVPPSVAIDMESFPMYDFVETHQNYRILKELYRQYAASTYKKDGRMPYTRFVNHLLQGGSIEIDDETVYFDSVLLPYRKPNESALVDTPHYRMTVGDRTIVMRQSTIPTDVGSKAVDIVKSMGEYLKNIKKKKEVAKISPADGVPVENPSVRYTESIPTMLIDNPDMERYNVSRGRFAPPIKTCRGTGRDIDLLYSDGNKDSDFFRRIHKSPFLCNSTYISSSSDISPFQGEELCITGFYIPSIRHRRIVNLPRERHTIVNDGDSVSDSIKHRKDYPLYTSTDIVTSSKELQKRIYSTVYSRFTNKEVDEEQFPIGNELYEPPMSIKDFDWTTIDDEKDYYVFFDKESINASVSNELPSRLSDESFNACLEKILPSIPAVLEKEKDTIRMCRNLTDLQLVLRPYYIQIGDITHEQFKRANIASYFKELCGQIKEATRTQQKKTRMMREEVKKVSGLLSRIQEHRWLRQRAIKGTQLTQYDFMDENLQQIIAQETRYLLNQSSLLTLLLLAHFLIGTVPSEEDFTVEYKDQIIDQLVEYFSENRSQVSEFYKVFHLFSDNETAEDPMYPNIEKLFHLYMDLFQVNHISSFELALYGKYDSNRLKEIQLMWNLNAHNSGGQELLSVFHLVQLLKYKKYIRQTIESYGKNEYEMHTGAVLEESDGTADIRPWEELNEDERSRYYPSKKLLDELHQTRQDIYDTYEAERKKHTEFLNQCGNMRICKIYHQLDTLYHDNGRDIYYDDRYDTTDKDLERYKYIASNNVKNMVWKEFQKYMREVYLFDTEDEIKAKIQNVRLIIENKDTKKKRKVIDGDVCMLSRGDRVAYYERIQNTWVPSERGHLAGRELQLTMEWLEMSFQELTNKMEESDCTTIPMDYHQVPVELRDAYVRFQQITRKEEMVKSIYQFYQQVDGDMKKLFEYLNERYYSLLFETQFKNRVYVPSSVYKRAIQFSKEQTNISPDVQDVEEKSVLRVPLVTPPQSLMTEFYTIQQIADHEIRYQQLGDFVQRFGIDYNIGLTEEYMNTHGIEESTYPPNSPFHPNQTTPETSTYLFFNIPSVNIPLICKHHTAFIRNPTANNEEKARILTEVKDKWGGGTSFFAEHILCRNCGEIIDYKRYSAFDGFDKQNKAIQMRERVVEYSDEDELERQDQLMIRSISTDFPDIDTNTFYDCTQLLRAILSSKQIKMDKADFKNIMDWVFKTISTDKETEYVDRITEFTKYTKYTKESDIANLKKAYKHTIYIERILAIFLHVLRFSAPEYVMKGYGFERKTSQYGKTYVFNDFYHNEDQLFPFFAKSAVDLMKVFAERNKRMKSSLFILTSVYDVAGKSLKSETSIFEQQIRFHYNEYAARSEVQQRYQEKIDFLKKQSEEESYRRQYGKWNTFLPSLEYSKEAIESSVIDSKSTTGLSNMYMMKVYQYITEQPQRDMRKGAYVGFVDNYTVQSSYLKSLLENGEIDSLRELYEQLQSNYEKSMEEIAHPANSVEFIVPKLMGRDLQDYMDVVEALMLGNEKETRSQVEKKNLQKKWIQFNLLTYLTKDKNGQTVGIPRIYKEIADDDFSLLAEIYSESEEQINAVDDAIMPKLMTKLRKKYRNSTKYNSNVFTDKWLEFKAQVILHMNTEENKLSCSFDIVSGKFKTDIKSEVEKSIQRMSVEELRREILTNERYSFHISETNMIEDRVRIPKPEKIEEVFLKTHLYQWMDTLVPRTSKIQENIDRLIQIHSYERWNVRESGLDDAEIEEYKLEVNSVYTNLLDEDRKTILQKIMKMYDAHIAGTPESRKLFNYQLMNLGDTKRIYQFMKDQLPQSLTIEGFMDNEQREDELQFRSHYYDNINYNNQLHVLYSIWQTIRNSILPNLTNKDLTELRAVREEKEGEIVRRSSGPHFPEDKMKEIAKWNKLEKYVNLALCIETHFTSEHQISYMSIFHPLFIRSIIRFMCISILSQVDLIENPAQQTIIFRDIVSKIESIHYIETTTTDDSYKVVQEVRANENELRKKKYEDMDVQLQALRKLSRGIGMGNVIARLVDEGDTVLTEEQMNIEERMRMEMEQRYDEDGGIMRSNEYTYDILVPHDEDEVDVEDAEE